jgi:hypothetical protein
MKKNHFMITSQARLFIINADTSIHFQENKIFKYIQITHRHLLPYRQANLTTSTSL